jgi:S1-C subfamily serine protease
VVQAFLSNHLGWKMRLHDDIRKVVVFLGLPAVGDDAVPRFGGTGFFVSHPAPKQPDRFSFTYLVTARHVAESLGGHFVIGVNDTTTKKTDLVPVDCPTWSVHPDDNVDIAVLRIQLIGAEYLPLPIATFADNDENAYFDKFGIGDLVYLVGLYRLFPGTERISPIVHTGHVAMTPDDPIPVRSRKTGQEVATHGYLIEAQTLEGLSGAPVLVRYTNPTGMRTGTGGVVGYSDSVFLLGVWQGAWDGVAGDTLSQQTGRQGARVPVGMGIVIPAKRIREVLALDEIKEERDRLTDAYLENEAMSQ